MAVVGAQGQHLRPLPVTEIRLYGMATASMASSMITTASTSMRGVSSTAGPPPGFPARGTPSPMDVLLAPQSYNLLAQAGVGRGLWPQPTPGSARPRAPGATSLHQE